MNIGLEGVGSPPPLVYTHNLCYKRGFDPHPVKNRDQKAQKKSKLNSKDSKKNSKKSKKSKKKISKSREN
jgi:hypothetical protein